MPNISECVGRGAAILDEIVPYWFTRINTVQMDVENPAQCIVAQLYGEAALGLHRLWKESKNPDIDTSPSNYGFACCFAQTSQTNDAWRREIHERLRVRAYYIWLNSGRNGDAYYNWMLAIKFPGVQSFNPFEMEVAAAPEQAKPTAAIRGAIMPSEELVTV